MICNVCQINEGRSYTRKNKEGKLITVSQPICKQCLANKSHKFPEHITKDFLIHEHIDLNKSALTIAKENNTSESKISGQLKQFEITEIIHCKDCDTTENLITRIINNQFNKPIEVTQKICYKCHKEKQGSTLSETRKNESGEQKAKRRGATKKYYENNPEQKIEEKKKRKETVANWSETKKLEHGKKISETKQNRTEEQKKESKTKLRKTLDSIPKDIREEQLKERGKRVSEALLNRSVEKVKAFNLKRMSTLIKNDSFYRSNSWQNNSQEFFSILHEFLIYLNINYNKIYYSAFNTEKGLYVGDLSLSNKKVRLYDFYLEIENNIYDIEFDEPYHNKILQDDLIREKEIYIKKPNIKIIRIKEDDYLNNKYKIIFDIIKILLGDGNKKYLPLNECGK